MPLAQVLVGLAGSVRYVTFYFTRSNETLLLLIVIALHVVFPHKAYVYVASGVQTICRTIAPHLQLPFRYVCEDVHHAAGFALTQCMTGITKHMRLLPYFHAGRQGYAYHDAGMGV